MKYLYFNRISKSEAETLNGFDRVIYNAEESLFTYQGKAEISSLRNLHKRYLEKLNVSTPYEMTDSQLYYLVRSCQNQDGQQPSVSRINELISHLFLRYGEIYPRYKEEQLEAAIEHIKQHRYDMIEYLFRYKGCSAFHIWCKRNEGLVVGSPVFILVDMDNNIWNVCDCEVWDDIMDMACKKTNKENRFRISISEYDKTKTYFKSISITT